MIGHKPLGEIRAELEAALGAGPTDGGQVAESLRRFLAGGGDTPNRILKRTGGGDPSSAGREATQSPPAPRRSR